VNRVLAAMALLAVVGCSSSGDGSLPSTTADATTTTAATRTAGTRYDPLSPEGQVELAYLGSWGDYASAVFDLDAAGLEASYSGAALDTVRAEVARRVADGRPAAVAVEHSYTIKLDGATQATVFDEYVSHQVDLDGRTQTPVEPDPAVTIRELYTLELIDKRWRVVTIERLR
jgi:hypothetical protein